MEGGVFLRDPLQRLPKPFLLGRGPGLHRHEHHRLGEGNPLKEDGMVRIAEGIAGQDPFGGGQSHDVPG